MKTKTGSDRMDVDFELAASKLQEAYRKVWQAQFDLGSGKSDKVEHNRLSALYELKEISGILSQNKSDG